MLFNKKYKILLVHNFYQKPGGEDTVFINEKKLLEDNGHTVITYTRDNSEIKGSVLKKILLPIITIFNIKTYYYIKRIIKENNIDIVHVHNTLCLISPAVFYAAVRMKVPVVQTLHNFRMQCANGLLYQNGHICEDCINKGIVCALKHKCYRNSFFQTLTLVLSIKIHRMIGIYKKVNYICLTKFNKEKLMLINKKKKVIDENKVFLKSNFIFDVPGSHPNITDRYSASNDSNRYLYVGRLDDIKGIDVVLETFSKMPNNELYVIGSGGEEYIKKYKNYTNIKFLGQISHDKVLMEMKNSSGLIYPTKLYEGQPISIIEAYMNKLPVITSNIGNANEMVKDGITGLHFISSSADSLVTALSKYSNMNKTTVRNNARIEFDNLYSDIKGYKNLIDVYNQIINNSGGL